MAGALQAGEPPSAWRAAGAVVAVPTCPQFLGVRRLAAQDSLPACRDSDSCAPPAAASVPGHLAFVHLVEHADQVVHAEQVAVLAVARAPRLAVRHALGHPLALARGEVDHVHAHLAQQLAPARLLAVRPARGVQVVREKQRRADQRVRGEEVLVRLERRAQRAQLGGECGRQRALGADEARQLAQHGGGLARAAAEVERRVVEVGVGADLHRVDAEAERLRGGERLAELEVAQLGDAAQLELVGQRRALVDREHLREQVGPRRRVADVRLGEGARAHLDVHQAGLGHVHRHVVQHYAHVAPVSARRHERAARLVTDARTLRLLLALPAGARAKQGALQPRGGGQREPTHARARGRRRGAAHRGAAADGGGAGEARALLGGGREVEGGDGLRVAQLAVVGRHEGAQRRVEPRDRLVAVALGGARVLHDAAGRVARERVSVSRDGDGGADLFVIDGDARVAPAQRDAARCGRLEPRVRRHVCQRYPAARVLFEHAPQ
mmetsp:Transcript_44083/g.109157  ORF Transcript_44083/g.109157 Transcript_44083/m.109157 type:complete len:496 (+) Transcript_44083:101-1588(+)